MGHHFVPRAYLRAFEDPERPGFVWVQPRREGADSRRASIDDVAQSSDYYDPTIEVELAQQVESPANPVLRAIRDSAEVAAEGRYQVAVYLATMIKRVPRSRVRGQLLVGPALESAVADVRDDLRENGRLGMLAADEVERRLSQLDQVFEKFSKEPPDEVKAQIRSPRATAAVIKAILNMHWRILVASPPEFFITSDNPAFFHSADGIGRPESELRFPLSPTIALHGTHVPSPLGLLSYHPAPKDWVREFNRSIASDATSIAISHCRAKWLATLVRRKQPYLSRLSWTVA